MKTIFTHFKFLTVAGGIFLCSIFNCKAGTFYSAVGATDPSLLLSWTSNPTGGLGLPPILGDLLGSNTFIIRAGQTMTTNSSSLNFTANLQVYGTLIVANSAQKQFGNITVNSGGTLQISPSANEVDAANIQVSGAGILNHYSNYNAGTSTLVLSGNLIVDGTYNYTGYTPAVVMNGSGSYIISSATSSLYDLFLKTGTLSASGGILGMHNLNIAAAGSISFSTNPTLNIAGDLTNAGNINTIASGNPVINISGNLNNTGSITNAGTSTPVYAITGNINNDGTLTIASSEVLNVKGNWMNNGSSTATGGTVNFNGTSDQTIGGTAVTTFNNLVINTSSSATVSLMTNNISILNNFTITSGTFNIGMLTANRSVLGGIFSIAANATLQVSNNSGGQSGSNFPSNFSGYTINPAANVEYNGSSSITQTIYAGVTYGNLILVNGSGGGTANKITTGIVNAAGTTSIDAFTRLTLGNSFTTGTAFNIISQGELYCASNIISGTGSFTLNQNGVLGIGHNAGITSSGAVGNIQNSGTRTFNNIATYIYNGNNNQSTGNGLSSSIGNNSTDGVANLIINNTGSSSNNIVYLSDDVQVNTTCNAIAGILNVGTDKTLYIQNEITKTGGFIDITDGSLNMNGTVAQTISGNVFTNKTVNNLIISNTSAGTVLSVGATTADSLKIKGLLSFGAVSGKIFNTNDNLTLLSTVNETASVGYLINNSIVGKVTAERYVNTGLSAGQHGQSWQLMSVPTYGQSIHDSWQEGGATPAGKGIWITGPAGGTGLDAVTAGPSMKYYNGESDSYIAVSNTSLDIARPGGYFVYVRGDRNVTSAANNPVPTVMRSTGNLFQPSNPPIDITVPIGKYESVGNPYACAIDIGYMKDNGGFTNLNNDVIVWDASLTGTYGAGIYQTLSATNNYVPTAGSASSFYPEGVSHPYIQSGQAFFVHSATGATLSGNVSFTEAAKYIGASVLANGIGGSLPDKQYFRAALYTSNGIITDGNALVFNDNYSNNIDADDALKILNGGENFAITRQGKMLSVEAHASIATADTLFYKMQNLKVSNYQIRFGPEAMHENINARLIDSYLGTITNISVTDSTYYNFSVTANPASAASDRFMVIFSLQKPLPVKLISISTKRNADKTITVSWNVDNEINIKEYSIERSTDGVTFLSVGTLLPGNNRNGTFSYSFIDQKSNDQKYFYRIRSTGVNADYSFSSVSTVSALKSEMITGIYPNPVVNKTMNVQFDNMPAGIYELKLISASGQKVYRQAFKTASGQIIKTILLSKSLAKGLYQLNITNEKGDVIINPVYIAE